MLVVKLRVNGLYQPVDSRGFAWIRMETKKYFFIFFNGSLRVYWRKFGSFRYFHNLNLKKYRLKLSPP